MKNKKLSIWLHRLPVLLLALILAVMPLTMASPAHADVLYSDSSFLIWEFYGDFVFTDILPMNFFAVYSNSEDYAYKVLDIYFDDSPLTVVLSSPDSYRISSSDGTVSRISYLSLEPIVFPLDLRGYDTTFDSYWSIPGNRFYGVYGDVTVPDDLRYFEPVISYGSNPSVFSVFSGVGTWFSDVLQNISTMFWTADSGMTVLGYLAVASLALAVILLIFYLIAGWLKFH